MSARNTFLRRGEIPDWVDEHIGRSWLRSGAHRVNPHSVPRQRQDPLRLLRAKTASCDLLEAAEPAVRLADEILGAEDHMVILTDPDGVCLRFLAPREQVRLDPAGNMFEGGSWKECDVGSNGLGSAVATRDPFVIVGPQHFVDDYVNWTCLGVPLRNPGGAFVGVFNLSVRNDRMSPHTWGWTLSLARNIEAALASNTPPNAREGLEALENPLLNLIGVFNRFSKEVEAPGKQAFIEQARKDLAQAEAQVRSKMYSLRVSQSRLEEWDQRKDAALAGIAHELKTPLAVIFMLLDLAEKKAGGVDSDTTAKLRRQAQRISRMIADVGDVGFLKRGALALEIERLDLNEVVRAAAEDIRPEAERRGHRLAVELCGDMLAVNGDPERLEQIVANLLVNAIKYTPAGGSIVVESAADGRKAVLRVRDTGLGIAPENLETIFDSFTRIVPAAGDPGGMGLGLALVANLVSLHDGTVLARSEGPGQGSEFEVRLPLQANS